MNKINKLKYLGLACFVLDMIIQGHWLFGRGYGGWIYDDSLHNTFIFLCTAAIIFVESRFVVWLALIGLLIVIILTIWFLVRFFRNKKCFLIPLCLMCVNVLLHIGAYWDVPSNYAGLIYKIISCAIFTLLVYREYHKAKE